MYTILINGYLILFLAFTSALFSTRFKYYYYDLDVNLIRYSADVKAKNSIKNLIMMIIIIIPYVALASVRSLMITSIIIINDNGDKHSDTTMIDGYNGYDFHNSKILILSTSSS